MKIDFEAGMIGAILILPQAVALAALAGMPPEYGIYSSIIPVIISALWGSSWHTVSGPNTALSVLIMVSVAPLAVIGSDIYIGYVLALTLMAGIIQLSIGVFKMGAVLDYISQTVISGIIFAVALIMLISSMTSFLGIETITGGSFFNRIMGLFNHLSELEINSTVIGIISLVAGLISRLFWRRYAQIVTVVSGTAAYLLALQFLPENASHIDRLGTMPIELLPFSFPAIGEEHWDAMKALLPSALSIAFLGLMQSSVISRSIAVKTGQQIDINQEAIGVGLANVVSPFISSFAGSGSFNRSAANYECGAKTPVASVIASILLALMVIFGSDLLAWLPQPAIAALLILVGLAMINFKEYKNILRSKHEALVFLITLFSALTFGLNAGVLIGVTSALIIYLWLASTPNITFESSSARDGQNIITVTIDGGLFFGSVNYIQRKLAANTHSKMKNTILLLNTDHLTYLDVPGASMLTTEALNWKDAGGSCYIQIKRKNISKALDLAEFSSVVGEKYLIYQHLPHPMKDILYPLRFTQNKDTRQAQDDDAAKAYENCDISALLKRLRLTRLFSGLSEKQLGGLLEDSEVLFAPEGDIIVRERDKLHDHLILIAGKLEAQRTWTTEEGAEKSYTWILQPGKTDGGFAFLGAATRQVRVRALTDIRYIKVDADKVDAVLGWVQHVAPEIGGDETLLERMELVMNVSAFATLPLENVTKALKQFQQRDVQASETIIQQGEAGDAYYLIENGQAKVIRTDPFTDETETVATLSAGDAFGEEALLQEGFRNATVEMTTPGKLLVLQKVDFDELVEPQMAAEIDAETALAQLGDEETLLIDCRYDMEYEESRIPGAIHIPLDRLRWDIHKLDSHKNYIVYCRSGSRSLAAAFLLSERHINVKSLKGGISNWPHEIDASHVDT